MKKTISLLCALVIFFGCVPSVLAADIPQLSVNETFNNYKTNGPAENVIIKTGLDGRVVEKRGNDKALYAKADRCAVKISVPIEKVFSQTVFSYEIMLKGDAVRGSAMELSGAKSRTIFSYSQNRSILLEDGLKIGGYSSGIWRRFDVCIDYNSGCYDLYIDGKGVLNNRRFYSAPSGTNSMNFTFSCLEDGDVAEVFIDNIMVYEGEKPLPASIFPSKGYNSEVLDYTNDSAQEQIYDTVFVDSNGSVGLPEFNLHQKTDTVAEWGTLNDGGKECAHFAKTGTEDCFADLIPELYENLQRYVYQVNVYVKNNAGTIIVARASGDGVADLMLIDSGGNLKVGSTAVAKVEYNKWVNLAVACDLLRGTCDVYVDRTCVAEGVEVTSVVPAKIRMGISASSADSDSEVYFDMIKMYDGIQLRTFATDDMSDNLSGDEYQIETLKTHTENETDADAEKILGTDIVFMTASGKFFAKGQKFDYKTYGSNAFLENGNIFVDIKVLEFATDTSISISDGKATINDTTLDVKVKGGATFVNAENAGKALGKIIYSKDNREFIILSDSNKNYTNNIESHQNQETTDLLWRYMQFDRPSGEQLFVDFKNSDVYKVHPRILIKNDEVSALKDKIDKNADMRNVFYSVKKASDTYFEKEPQPRNMVGIRLFSSCYEVRTRLFDLCTVYLLTGDEKYAERAWLEMENALNWSDWNVKVHFLDAGKLVSGMAYAYDTLYHYLTPERKQFFIEKIQEKFLDYAVGVYTGTSGYNAMVYNHVSCNWGAVISSSMLMLAMTLIDEDVEGSLLNEKCKYLASNALQTFEHIITAMAPEGTWGEGIGYFEYVQQALGWTIETLDNTTGKDYNFMSAQGVEEFSEFMMNMSTTNGIYNYGSPPTTISSYMSPTAFIFSNLYENGTMKSYDDYRRAMSISSFLPEYLLFYDPAYVAESNAADLPLDKLYHSAGLASVRSAWMDEDSLYLGVTTAGRDNAHADKGAFMFESQGVRWVVDVGRNGSDEMEIVHRTENESTVVINPDADDLGQDINFNGEITKFESRDKGAIVVCDLSSPYEKWVNNYERGFLVSDDRNTLVVRDEIELKELSDIKWHAITEAKIEISADGKSALMKQDGKVLEITGYCNAENWKFEVVNDLTPTGGWQVDGYGFGIEEQQAFVAGKRKLALSAKASGKLEIAVKFAPKSADENYAPVDNTPISQWNIPEGTLEPKPQADAIYMNGQPLSGFIPGVKDYTVPLDYGSTLPWFSATTSYGTVSVKQPAAFDDYAEITVITPEGKKATYRVFFEVDSRVTDAHIETKPTVGLPTDMKLLDIINVMSDHEPESHNPAKSVADGNFDTRWSSDMKGAYVEVDLGQIYELSGIALAFAYGESRNYKFDILVSEDKMNYKRVYSGYSLGGTNGWEYLPLPVKAKYVRYVGYQHKDGVWNSVTEVRPVIKK